MCIPKNPTKTLLVFYNFFLINILLFYSYLNVLLKCHIDCKIKTGRYIKPKNPLNDILLEFLRNIIPFF